jgi:hypothetical protein
MAWRRVRERLGWAGDWTVAALEGLERERDGRPLFAAGRIEMQKEQLYVPECRRVGIAFIPVIFKSFGAAGPQAKTLLKQLTARVTSSNFHPSNWSANTPLAYWKQRVSIAIQHHTAVAVRNKIVHPRIPLVEEDTEPTPAEEDTGQPPPAEVAPTAAGVA